MNFNHRLNRHNIDAPENCSLVDVVDAMTRRAGSVVSSGPRSVYSPAAERAVMEVETHQL